ncbi:DUF6636 domain-containing protein [Mycobacterium sp. pR1184]|uniref:DUF6636 domain-containing protein n=1 Tax=Mycobacterium sp. pR1184 TaxID=3238981 RepID=UPI00351B6FF0
MKTRTARFSVQLAAALAIVAGAPAAHADTDYQFFRSPSGNIACLLGTEPSGPQVTATCQVGTHTFAEPPRPGGCAGGWGDRVSVTQGRPASMQCHTDTLLPSHDPVLAYGQSRSAGPITCVSAPSGMTCTDTTTGHGFSLSQEGYRLS